MLEVVGGAESLDGLSKTEISRAVVLETFDVSFEEKCQVYTSSAISMREREAFMFYLQTHASTRGRKWNR